MIQRSWRNARVALQLLAEERVGQPRRDAARLAREREDAAAAGLAAEVKNRAG